MTLPHILLGLLVRPASGYGLRTEIERRCGHFWAAGLSQIYPTLHRLEREGWLARTAERSAVGPKRQIHQTTPAGREKLREWLRAGPDHPPERLPWLAQVRFLAGLNDREQARAFLERLRSRLAGRLQALAPAGRPPAGPSADLDEAFFEEAALRCARRTAEDRLAWCEETLAALSVRVGQDR